MFKFLIVKAAVGLAVVAGAGGVAVASTTGALPTMLSGDSRPTQVVEPVRPSAETEQRSDRPTAGPPEKARDGRPAGAQGSPSPDLVGLCRAYAAGNKAEHGKALESPAFRALIRAAGGPDKVEGFCAAALASRSGPPTDHQDRARRDDAGGRPDGVPPGRGAGKPSSPPGR